VGQLQFWGYRRVWAWLRSREHSMVNKKRGYHLMREADLLVKKRPKPATRTSWSLALLFCLDFG
jgi:hypothetical protein